MMRYMSLSAAVAMLATSCSALAQYQAANAPVVISQVYGGGGNSGALFNQDFIELFNRSGSVQTLTGYSVQFASANNGNYSKFDLPSPIVMQPGHYYLIACGATNGAAPALPTPDATATGFTTIGAAGTRCALVSNTTLLTASDFTGSSPAATSAIVDFLGFGTSSSGLPATQYEGTARAGTGSNSTAAVRNSNGCSDTGDNSADFLIVAPSPRNSTTFWDCNGVSPQADIDVQVVNNTGSCVQNGNYAANYTFTVTNLGPTAGNDVAAALTAVTSATGNVVVSTGSYSNGVWTIGTMAPNGTATLTWTANIVSPGADRVTLTASTSTLDPVTTNNAKTASNSSPDTVTAAKPVFRSASTDTTSGTFGQDTANIGNTGFQFAGKTFAFGRPFFSPSGHRWIMVAEMANLLDSNSIIIVGNDNNYFIALQELPYNSGGVDLGGGVKVFSSATQAGNCFDRAAAIDDAGNIAFSCQAVASASDTTFSRAVVRGAPGANFGDPYSWTVIAYEGDAVPAAVNTAIGGSNRQWDGQMYVAGVNGSDVAFYAHLRAGTPALLNNADEVLVTANGTSVLVTESVTALTGTAYPFMGTTATTSGTDKAFDQNTDSNFTTRGFKRAGAHWSTDGAIGRASTPTPAPATADQVLVVDGTVVLQEGNLLPGFSGADTIAASSLNNLTNFNSLSDDGTWYAYGVNAVVSPATRGTAWLVKGSGATVTVLAKSGDPIMPASSETWSNVVSGQTFLGVVGRGNDLVTWGLTSNPDTSRDAVVVWKNGSQSQILLREGDPIDIGNPGSPNIIYCSSFIDANRAAIDANRNLWITAQTRNSQWPCTLASADTLGQVLLKIALPPAVHACNRADIAGLGGGLGADGQLTVDDLVTYLSNFFSGNLAVADLTNLGGTGGPDGQITVDDLVFFLSQFFSPCNP